MVRSAAPIPRRRFAKRLTLAGVSLLGAMLLGELVLFAFDVPSRFAAFAFQNEEFEDEDFMVQDEELFWRLKSDAKNIHVNEIGLRGHAFSASRGLRDLRIACVGDSCTFGWGSSYETTWGMQLEAQLRDALPGARVETLLAAVPGYSTWQDRKLVESVVRPLTPDVTILYCGAYNDYVGAVGRTDTQTSADLRAMRENPLYWSRIARLIHAAATREEPDLAAMQRGEFAQPRVTLEQFVSNVEAMIAGARADGSRVLGIVPPIPGSTLQKLAKAQPLRYLAALRAVYAKHRVPFVDGPEVFRAAAGRLPKDCTADGDPVAFLFHDFVHPNPLGHCVLARAVCELLLDDTDAKITELRALSAPDTVRVESVQPTHVPPLAEGVRVEVRATGVAQHEVRVFVGARWVREVTRRGEVLSFDLPNRVTRKPGRHALRLVTASGTVTAPGIEVTGMPLQARLAPGREGALELLVRGQPGAKVRVWLSPGRRSAPFATMNGDVDLPGAHSIGLDGFPFAPLRFAAFDGLAHIDGVVGPKGLFHKLGRLPAALRESTELYVQGVVVEGDNLGRGVTTTWARVALSSTSRGR